MAMSVAPKAMSSSLAFHRFEELIAFGATDIAIPKISLALYAMDVLPDSLRKRIQVIDKKRTILQF